MLSMFLMLNVLLGYVQPAAAAAARWSLGGDHLPSDGLSRSVREFTSTGVTSMLGLLVAWRVFPVLTEPLFATVLKLLHPDLSYG